MRRLIGRLAWRVSDWAYREDPGDPVLLVPAGGVYRRDSIEGDDLWVAEQQVQWWLEVGQQLREYAGHTPDCRLAATPYDLHDLRCSCGLLEVIGQVEEVVACTITDDDELLDRRRL
jgi:hypothetical protein